MITIEDTNNEKYYINPAHVIYVKEDLKLNLDSKYYCQMAK